MSGPSPATKPLGPNRAPHSRRSAEAGRSARLLAPILATAVLAASPLARPATLAAAEENPRTYKVPGIVALQTASQYGWRVSVKNTLVAGGDCRWRDDTLTATPPAKCWVHLFTPPRADCGTLRSGWRIRRIVVSGADVSWLTEQRDSVTGTGFRLVAETRPQSVRVDRVELYGPRGPGVGFARAFNHCRR